MPVSARNPVNFPTPPAESGSVVVCERGTRWAVAVRALLESGAKVVETRGLDDAWQQLQTTPHGALLIEIEPQRSPQQVALLVRIQTELPHVMIIACVASASPDWELLLREAGAAVVLRTPRRLPGVAPWLRRHLARVPQRKLNLRERIWDHLPWPEAARPAPDGGALPDT
jgi:CheY-like chemotaxis protein